MVVRCPGWECAALSCRIQWRGCRCNALQCEAPHLAFAVSMTATLIGTIDFVASTASVTVTSIGMIDFVAFTITTISTTLLFSITSVFPSFPSLRFLHFRRSSTYLLVPYPYGNCYPYGYGTYHGDYGVFPRTLVGSALWGCVFARSSTTSSTSVSLP
jgi:hypothetical protein